MRLGWWKGEHCGCFGWVPNEFVSPLDLHEAEEISFLLKFCICLIYIFNFDLLYAKKRASAAPVQQEDKSAVNRDRKLTNVAPTSISTSSENITVHNINNHNNINNNNNDATSSPSSPASTEPTTPRTAKANFLKTFQPQLQPIVRQPSSVISQPEVIKAGYLRKKGAKRRNWTKRY